MRILSPVAITLLCALCCGPVRGQEEGPSEDVSLEDGPSEDVQPQEDAPEKVDPIPASRKSDCPPFGQHRFVDPTRRFYVVLKEEPQRPWWNQQATFAFVRANEGRPYVGRLWRAEGYTENERQVPTQLEGDEIISQGQLPEGVGMPGTVLVSSNGWGFVALAGWCDWHTHSNDVALTVIESSGALTRQLRLKDLFSDEELSELPFVRGPRSWLHGAWIDDATDLIVVVADGASKPFVRMVDRLTGKLRDIDNDVLYAALESPDPIARGSATTVLGANRGFNGENRQLLLALLEDENPAVRLRAAIVLDEASDERGFLHLQIVALDPDARMIDRRTAVEVLLRSHLDEAIQIVRPLLPDADEGQDETVLASGARAIGQWSSFVMSILLGIGDEAIPRMVDIALDETLLYEYRQKALDTLARLETEAALAMLATFVGFDDDRLSSRALRLLIVREDDRSIPGRLCQVLAQGPSLQEATIARYFKNREYRASVEPLHQALARLDALEELSADDVKTRNEILAALAYQRGEG